MHQTDDDMSQPENFDSDRSVWRYCRAANAPSDEAARFLDLAAYADGLLDEEERDRIAFLLAGDAEAAADVAAARMLQARGDGISADLEEEMAAIIARADALVADGTDAPGRVLPFRPPPRLALHRFAEWGSLAAAIVVASWLGFAMGRGASLTLIQPAQPSQIGAASFLPEMLDPTTGFLRDLIEGQQT
jgi:anti-sigma factor RsiW